MTRAPSPRYWSGRRVLVTGHTGFKGAWLVRWLWQLGAIPAGLALDPVAGPASAAALPHLEQDFRLDLRDNGKVAAAVREAEPEVVFHLAAQALVRQSYRDPVGTFAVNAVGTASLLEAIAAAPTRPEAVVVVTSDKVYRNDGNGCALRESDPLGGSDPYSLSKAFAEEIVREWRSRHPWAKVGTVRAGNVIGGGDRGAERLLVDAWDAFVAGRPVRLRNPGSTRPWQHVLDPLRGYLLFAETLAAAKEAPQALNFGPGPAGSVAVASLVELAADAWGGGEWQADRGEHPREARTLVLDSSLATRELDWQIVVPLDEAVSWTVEWWRAAEAGDPFDAVMDSQLEQYRKRLS